VVVFQQVYLSCVSLKWAETGALNFLLCRDENRTPVSSWNRHQTNFFTEGTSPTLIMEVLLQRVIYMQVGLILQRDGIMLVAS